ncbi:MAG: Rieske 2Fe-2S domain-containing protein [Gammaproteobacteria bacterium]|nr:Rieske 2Fe-2S domain-containing protein [Gammaproteobacteria bacterium]MYJ52772.1 Rieske 2Fe-2S domain-containing protein [Gammaproteobacteria bacterium]
MLDLVRNRNSGAARDDRKRRLVDAAIGCIGQSGLEGATVVRITRAAGLPPGAVKTHFGSREKLLCAAFDSIGTGLKEALSESIDGLVDPEEILERVIRVHFDPALCNMEALAAWNAFMDASRLRRDGQKTWSEWRDQMRSTLEAQISALDAQDSRYHADSRTLARGLEGLLVLGWQEILSGEGGDEIEQAVAMCRSYLASLFPGRFGGDLDRPARAAGKASPEPALSDLLPRWTYRNPEFFELEMERLFKPNWLLAGHVSEVASPGDYLTFDASGERALVIRSDDGRLRAFHNVCRHRGAMLFNRTRGQCRGDISCPFHGWTYDTRGKLIGIPARRTFRDLDPEKHPLMPLELEVWMGFVFVRFIPGGESLKDIMAPVEHLIVPYRVCDMRPLPGTEYCEIRPYNWKIIHDIDNEGYHVPVGHPSLQQLYGQDYRDTRVGEIPVSRARMNEKRAKSWSVRHYQDLLPRFGHLPEENQRLWLYIGVFPNAVIGLYPDSAEFYMTLPKTPQTTLFRGRAYGLDDDRREVHAARYLNRRINYITDREDEQYVEAMQDGLYSSAFPEQILSDREQGVRDFHKAVQKMLPVANLAEEPALGQVAASNVGMEG